MAHRATWTSKSKSVNTRSKTNQIDYIITQIKNKHMIENSRSYSGHWTDTDHKLVICQIKFEKIYKRIKPNIRKNVCKLNLEKLSDNDIKEKFQVNIQHDYDKLVEENEEISWKNLSEIIKNSSIKYLKSEEKHADKKYIVNPLISKLSAKQKDIRNIIESTTNENLKNKMKKERNAVMKCLHKEIKIENSQKEEREIEELANTKNDSIKMFKVLRKINRQKPKEKLFLRENSNIIQNENVINTKITEHFKDIFYNQNTEILTEIKPEKMKTPFSTDEIKNAVRKLKTNKSPGSDEITAEELKNCPEKIYNEIAKIFNKMAETGKYPEEIKLGILIPLQKPGKVKGTCSNLRPIILLNLIRKILSIVMINRIYNKIDKIIPVTQAAYRPGRSTTEHVLTLKLLIEKAITNKNSEIEIMLLDMSKAFDTVNRNKLLEDLSKIIDQDELHIIKLIIDDVILRVKNGDVTGNEFETNIGIPQGDCLSPVLFTFYLANSLNKHENQIQIANQIEEHSYSKENIPYEELIPNHIIEHNYSIKREMGINIDQQFADDIAYVSTCKNITDKIQKEVNDKLNKRDLKLNTDKTEKYTIGNKNDQEWKKCKYLGSYLDTERDMIHRKQLCMAIFNKYKMKLTNSKITMKTRINIFNAYITPVYLYNSELWTLTSKQEHEIDIFHRSLLRKILKIYYPHIISNDNLYIRTNEKKESCN